MLLLGQNNYKGKYRNVITTEYTKEAIEIQKEMQKDSKWPDCVLIWPCWLKEYEHGMKYWDVNSEK